MAKTTTFEQNVETSYQYLWSNASNWSNGVPVNGDDVISSPANYQGSYYSTDNISALSISVLNLNGGGGIFSVSGTLTVDSLVLPTSSSGASYYVPVIAATNDGTITVDKVSGFYNADFEAFAGGRILLDTGASESFVAGNGGVAELAAQPVGSQFVFNPGGGTFQFDALSRGTTIGNSSYNSLYFVSTSNGDSIELPGTSVSSVVISANSIDITTNSTSLDLVGISYSSGATTPTGFTSALDTKTGLEKVTFTACYCPGALIATERGEVPVETLMMGDFVVTADGRAEPIRWIGRRTYSGRFICKNHLMLPVTINASALADGVPHTDLQVSPGHAMWVDGQLVPAWRLVNGVTITQTEMVQEVTYLHVELHSHALLLANGAPAESFLAEAEFREQFHNAREFNAIYPDAPAMMPMQVRLEDGFALLQIRERLAARAGVAHFVEPAGALRGYVDQAGPNRVCGWAQDINSPEEPVALEISVSGVPFLCALANCWRADLRQAGIGSGCHAFDVTLPAGLIGAATVRRITDGSLLPVAINADIEKGRVAA